MLIGKSSPYGIMHTVTEGLTNWCECTGQIWLSETKCPMEQQSSLQTKGIWFILWRSCDPNGEVAVVEEKEDSAFSLKTWVFTWHCYFRAVWLWSHSSKSLGLSFITCKTRILTIFQNLLGDWKRKGVTKGQVKEFILIITLIDVITYESTLGILWPSTKK